MFLRNRLRRVRYSFLRDACCFCSQWRVIGSQCAVVVSPNLCPTSPVNPLSSFFECNPTTPSPTSVCPSTTLNASALVCSNGIWIAAGLPVSQGRIFSSMLITISLSDLCCFLGPFLLIDTPLNVSSTIVMPSNVLVALSLNTVLSVQGTSLSASLQSL